MVERYIGVQRLKLARAFHSRAVATAAAVVAIKHPQWRQLPLQMPVAIVQEAPPRHCPHFPVCCKFFVLSVCGRLLLFRSHVESSKRHKALVIAAQTMAVVLPHEQTQVVARCQPFSQRACCCWCESEKGWLPAPCSPNSIKKFLSWPVYSPVDYCVNGGCGGCRVLQLCSNVEVAVRCCWKKSHHDRA